MKISLILCTIHRVDEVNFFLDSLCSQKHKDYELIIVDQNSDDRLVEIIDLFKNKFNIVHIHSKKGLSRARNVGLEYVTGDIVAFPDDDCTYPPELLENINNFFSNNQYSILMGKTIDKDSGIVVAGKSIHQSKELSCYQFLGTSTTLFLNLKNIDKNDICFDIELGVGATFHSGEEEDLIIRLLEKGYNGFYAPDINYVYHPPSDLDFSNLDRIKDRSKGLGAVIVKHIFSLCGIFYFVKYVLIHPFVSIIQSIIIRDLSMVKYHYFRFIGILSGLFCYSTKNLKK